MSSSRTTASNPLPRVFYAESDLESMAIEALRKAGFSDAQPAPVPIELVVLACLGIQEKYLPLDEGILGEIWFHERGVAAIHVSDDLADLDDDPTLDRRRRSTIAHELGHALAHTHLFVEQIVQGKSAPPTLTSPPRHLACRIADISPETQESHSKPAGYRWLEWQANSVMASLLTPKRAVQRCLDCFFTAPPDGYSPSVLPSKHREQAIHQVSQVFNVSRQMASIRIERLYPPALSLENDFFAAPPA